jgi:hypothetical protein
LRGGRRLIPIVGHLQAVSDMKIGQSLGPFLALSLNDLIVLLQHGLLVWQTMAPRPVRFDQVSDAPQQPPAPPATIHGSQIDCLSSHLAALAAGALLIPILSALDGLDDDVCHASL